MSPPPVLQLNRVRYLCAALLLALLAAAAVDCAGADGAAVAACSRPEVAAERLLASPSDLGRYLALAAAHRRQGDLEPAIRALEGAVLLQPENLILRQELGLYLLEAGRLADAEGQLRRSLAGAPGLLPARLGLGRLYLARRQYEAANLMLNAAARSHPENAEIREAFGLALSEAERWGEAAAEFRTAVRLAPERASAHLGRGQAAAHLGLTAEAETSLRRAQELAPRDPAILHALGYHTLRSAAGKADLLRAAELLEAAARRAPGARTWYLLAKTYQQLDLPERALLALEAGLRLDPGDTGAWYLLAAIHADLRQPGRAATARERFETLSRLRNEEESLRRRMTAVRPAGEDYLRLADLLRRQGRDRQAVAELEQAVQRSPDDTVLRRRLDAWRVEVNRRDGG